MNPLRLGFVLALAAAAAAGFGVRSLEEAGPRRRSVFLWSCAALCAAVLAFSFVAGTPGVARLLDPHLFAQRPEIVAGTLAKLRSLRSIGSAVIAWPLALALAAGGLFAAYAARARFRTALLALLAALLACDLIGFGWRYNTRCRPEELYRETPSIAYLRAQPGPFRVVTDARSGFLANVFVPFGIEEIGGYSSFYPERAGRLLSFAEYGSYTRQGLRFDRWVLMAAVGSPLLDIMNVRYVLKAPGSPPPDHVRYTAAFRGDMTIWENRGALPRAYVVPRAVVRRTVDEALDYLASPAFRKGAEVVLEEEPSPAFLADAGRAGVAAGAVVERYLPDRVTLTASAPERGWLVLSDAWYPGWEATVDGRPERILRANVNFRALPLRAGVHRVEFAFRPPVVRRGRMISAAGVLLLLAGFAAVALPRRTRAGGGA